MLLTVKPAQTTSRLDLALMHLGLAPSRERAQALIAAGLVEVDGAQAVSASQKVSETTSLTLKGADYPWASRAGVKLAGALDNFQVSGAQQVALDAGASTGGFVDVLLSRGASLVYAVDVGHGQLLTRLATDPRVQVMDRTNLRNLEELSGPAPTLVTLDLSFISLRTVMDAVVRVAPQAQVVALYKPQFELGKAAVGRGGIVHDQAAAEAGCSDFLQWAAQRYGAATPYSPYPAPLKGTKGNQEWWAYLQLPGTLP
jgi:23S rRNA (cytidine1920-2'-O)/16S rRNA (cytidine1409-2'-O)-methyltransferase